MWQHRRKHSLKNIGLLSYKGVLSVFIESNLLHPKRTSIECHRVSQRYVHHLATLKSVVATLDVIVLQIRLIRPVRGPFRETFRDRRCEWTCHLLICYLSHATSPYVSQVSSWSVQRILFARQLAWVSLLRESGTRSFNSCSTYDRVLEKRSPGVSLYHSCQLYGSRHGRFRGARSIWLRVRFVRGIQ